MQEAVYLFLNSRVIDARYREKARPVIHEQLATATVRVVEVLNRALGTN